MTNRLVNYVKKVRTKKDLTQEQLADQVGVTRQTIIAIEKGNYTPSVLLALKIARSLSYQLDKMFILK